MDNNQEFIKNENNWKTPSFEEVLCETNTVKIKDEHQNETNTIIPEIPPENIIYIKEAPQQLNENIEIVNNIGLTEPVYVINIIANEIPSNVQYLDCRKCGEKYDLFCTKCHMLVHVLDKNLGPNDLEIPLTSIPDNILEVRGCYDGFGVFVKKTIPKNVRFGPFIGLDSLQCTTGSAWKLRHGELVRTENKKFSNWMQYIKRAEKMELQNLNVFQCENQLYYRTNRVINAGEQLLVYYGVENVTVSNNNDEKMFCFPKIENYLSMVYGCTFCCVGFSTLEHLKTHKTACSYMMNIQGDIGSVNQCSFCRFCRIYMDENEYRYYHLNNCHYKHTGSLTPPIFEQLEGNSNINNNVYIQENRNENISYNTTPQPDKILISIPTQLGQDVKFDNNLNIKKDTNTNVPDKKFKCLKCSYSTNYSQSLKRHMCNIHDEKKPFQCTLCNRQFVQKGSLTLHIMNKHTNDKNEYKCIKCSFQTTRKTVFKKHMKESNCFPKIEHVSSTLSATVEQYQNTKCLVDETNQSCTGTFPEHMETHVDVLF